MRILFIGDIVGAQGRRMVLEHLPRLLDEYAIDFTIANGENCSGGFGLNQKNFRELVDCGIDAFTMGNHMWDNRDIYNFIDHEERLVRPANFPPSLPGRGWQQYQVAGQKLIVANVVGRVFMTAFDCPFRTMDAILQENAVEDVAIFVDIHAEATSEKMALGWYLDGRVAAVVGTHTHIQTNDARILPGNTAYLTDVGMTGPKDSVLGMAIEPVVERFRTGKPCRFTVAEGDLQLNGVLITCLPNGAAQQIQLISLERPEYA